MAPSKRNQFVVFSWTPEGRAVIGMDPSAPPVGSQTVAEEGPWARLRRLGGRFDTPFFYLLLLAISGFALGYAVQVLPR
jgi:hypothetical protein